MLKTFALVAASTLALAAASPASAAVFNFTVGGGAAGSGTLTTQDTANANGGFLITGITGSINGGTITALLAPGTYGGNNNLLFPSANPLVDGLGFSFVNAGTNYNIYYSIGFASYRLLSPADSVAITFGVTPAAAAVPEAATWAMMLAGFGMIGFGLRSRKQARVTFA